MNEADVYVTNASAVAKYSYERIQSFLLQKISLYLFCLGIFNPNNSNIGNVILLIL